METRTPVCEGWRLRGSTTPRDPVHIIRIVRKLSAGVIRFDQQISMRTTELGMDASGPHWIVAFIRVLSGRLLFLADGNSIAAPASCAMILPPGSLIQVHLDKVMARTVGFCWRTTADVTQSGPVLVAWDGTALPGSGTRVRRFASKGRNQGIEISRCSRPSALASAAKRYLERAYMQPEPLSRLARRLGCTATTLSRTFKKHYGITPGGYRHVLRSVDAMMRLVSGLNVADVSGDVGYNDLSRFYSQFRKHACAPPAQYRPKSKNAKTSPLRS